MSSQLGRRVAIVSPHLDDGVLSLGAAIAHSTRFGADVRVVTVFANDPATDEPATEWDADCGFSSAADAARGRRREDSRACELLGATAVWLPFTDSDHGGGTSDDELLPALHEALSAADAVLVPGYPLVHPDHARLTRLLLAEPPPDARIGLYVEQPYATWRHLGRGRRVWAAPDLTPARGLRNAAAILLRTRSGRRLQRPVLPEVLAEALTNQPVWTVLRSSLRDTWAKQRALRAYRSQFAGFGRATAPTIAVYELGWGGEGVAWIESPHRRGRP
jgi:LmbE family N-acetylglucosaminyl deacetylase